MNDGSTDRTAEVAERAGAIVVNLTGRPGLGNVFRTGLERAMRRGADIIVNIDGDGQFNSADIPKLVQPILERRGRLRHLLAASQDPALRPTMPKVKFWGNHVVTRIINWVCGGTNFTDVSCGFRAFNREAAYRLTLFGRYTYTQECFIDLFSKGMRIVEVPLKVRGVREHGKSRVASSISEVRDQLAADHPARDARHPAAEVLRRHRRLSSASRASLTGGVRRRLVLVHRCTETAHDLAVHAAHPDQRRAGHARLLDVRAGAAGRHDGPASADQRRTALPGPSKDLFQPPNAQGRAASHRGRTAWRGADAARFVVASGDEGDPSARRRTGRGWASITRLPLHREPRRGVRSRRTTRITIKMAGIVRRPANAPRFQRPAAGVDH